MPDTVTLQLAQHGVLTLPKDLLDSYNLRPGDTLTPLDLGGVFVLRPRHSEIDTLADRLSELLAERGETLETMLQALHEERGH